MRYILKFSETDGLQLETGGRIFRLGVLEGQADGVDFRGEMVCMQGEQGALHAGDCLKMGDCRLIYLGGADKRALLQMGKIKAILTDEPQSAAESVRAMEADFVMSRGGILGQEGAFRFQMEPDRAYSVYEIMENL